MRATFLKALFPATILAFTVQANTAKAFFDAELTVGKRWYSLDADDGTGKHGVQSQEVQVAAHIDPIPLVPVSFGALINMGTLNTKDLGSDASSGAVFQAGLDVQAWLPMVPVVTPFVRLTIPVYGTLVEKYTALDSNGAKADAVATSKISGYHLNAGIKYSLIPLLKLTFELGTAAETAKPDEVKVGGNKLDLGGVKSTKLASSSAAIGLEVGF